MLILNDKDEPIYMANFALEVYWDGDEAMSFQLRFRWSMFAVCCSIQEDRITYSMEKTRYFLENYKKETDDEKEICFWEVLF